jgi:cysteine desulfurase / selenocysteine lyase
MTPTRRLDVRADFPFLSRRVNGKPLVYLDNAATTQKPNCVIEQMHSLYSTGIANVHRAVNFLAEEVTQSFEQGRDTIASFIGAHAQDIVFTNNATHGINIVCSALCARGPLRVLTSTLEHHSNLLPWTSRGSVDFIPWDRSGVLDLDVFRHKLRQKPDLVAVAYASNFLGTFHPVREMAAACREHHVPILIDASQSIAHHPVDVRDLDCDFLVFSGHKVYGPGGIGVLYMKSEHMQDLAPVFVGGSMVKEVHAVKYVLNDLPHRFEAGTPNVEGVIGIAAAVRYLQSLGYGAITEHENQLAAYAKQELSNVPGVTLYGPRNGIASAPLIPFQVKTLDPGAVAKTLGSRANVIVRSGFHCAQPAHDELGISPTIRASFGVYNTASEVDVMVDVLKALTRFVT